MPQPDRGRKTAFYYALPAMAAAVPTIPAYVLLPSYYGDDLGLGLALTGAILLAVRIIDMLTDPLAGWLSDYTGRRKIWVGFGAVIAGIGIWMLFVPPDQPGGGHLFVSASILFLGWTLFQVPYLAWGADLSGDYRERTLITSLREGAGLIGIVIAGAIPVVMMNASRADEIRTLAMMTIVAGAVFVTILIIKVPDSAARPGRGRTADTQQAGVSLRARFTQSLRSLRQNRLFVRLLAAWMINGLAGGLPAVCFPLFVRYYLKLDTDTENALILLYFVAAIAAIPFWVFLAGKISKHRVWCVAMIMAVSAFAFVPFLSAGDWAGFAVICVFTGAALGADLALPPAIQADVDDWDRYRFHASRTGVLFALWNMTNKLAMALAAGIALPILGAFGLTDGGDENSAALIALVMIYAVLPIVLKAGAIGMMWRFPLDRVHQVAIRRRLARRTF
ncbi:MULTISPECIES: MFS transporter [Thalassospira]|uniref:MFS transporter n=1 Tax=Thalassospira TaxID=168934 RepID=UPI0008DDD482|nr:MULTISPECIES: MFS transporter [Thalassospira]MAB34473.1 MFS transporter [Thalassospira sp.]MDM7978519.1 MFS transporter [Thalassospira xiamenensis]OHZ01841.1 MFS transporter [Thalassospira sp. MIT1004]HBS23042.1 MFS transporter [Thalassospira sp.]